MVFHAVVWHTEGMAALDQVSEGIMKNWSRWVKSPIWIAASIAVAGCMVDEGPLGLEGDRGSPTLPGGALALLDCRVDLRGGVLGCAAPEPSLPGGISADLITIGGQGSYVLLESSDVRFDSDDRVFSATVTVRNLLTQPLGTSDGAEPDAKGVRVFFVNDPSNGVTVKDPSGIDIFNASLQLYFQYDQVLVPGRRSMARTWEWDVPEGVSEFQFQVAVSAEIPGGAYDASGRPLTLDPQTITVGGFHSCGLTLSGTAYCWGSNEFGQLGTGTSGGNDGPSAILGHTFTEITAGYKHTCALDGSGKAYCWGLSADGQLGNGDFGLLDPGDEQSYRHRTVPVEVQGGHEFLDISAGGLNTCAVTKDGDAYCWGRGREGQLGNGKSGIDDEDPTRYVFAPTPTQVLGSDYVAISVGGSHACALNSARDIYCWGVNEWGQIGNGAGGAAADSVSVPQLVAAAGLKFSALSAGLTHTCALAEGGSAYCWGETSAGRLGNGEGAGIARFRPTPQPVMGGHTFASLSAGAIHSCGVTPFGEALCWGRNGHGQLGVAAPTDSVLAPVAVTAGAGVAPFSAIGALGSNEYGHTCALTTAGALYCWGSNREGQIGQPAGIGSNPDPLRVEIANTYF